MTRAASGPVIRPGIGRRAAGAEEGATELRFLARYDFRDGIRTDLLSNTDFSSEAHGCLFSVD